ncbi:response regulator [Maridesulfovibrio bastinii]|uniref:response regulator n=1 Tax=Maridesulfovibrio bastinii TaxID=47157 RepID=UPI0003F9D2BE|nr:response regulator [Maridesulfovibrio bastinii]
MSDIFVFSGVFCQAESVIKNILDQAGARLVTDDTIISEASDLSGIDRERIAKVLSGKVSIFNRFSHERERSIAWMRYALAKRIVEGDNMLVSGMVAHLLTQEIDHVLKVCLIDDMAGRIEQASESGLSEKDAHRAVMQGDEIAAEWVKSITGSTDPWNSKLYDIIIPVNKTGVEQAAALIMEQLGNAAVKLTPASQKMAEDFLLAAKVETELVSKGHSVQVEAKDGTITLSINQKVLLVDRLEKELLEIAGPVEGVKDVSVKFGKDFYEADIYRKMDFELPSKVLLVDDEREFVQTLSERLMLRDLGSAVVYDGASALDLVNSDEPEVMILDLKMPGIDGIEVLRRVKAERPGIEVVILTGHGSEKDRETCMELGAFAYLNKPVDIDVLSETLKKAYSKVRNS